MSTGVVASLHRWPVKSMGGEPVEALRVDGRGAIGDRAHVLLDAERSAPGRPKLLTAREAPRLLAWRATYTGVELVPDDVPLPTLHPPAGGAPMRWDDPALPDRLAADLGRRVTLVRDGGGRQDLGESLLVTTAASLAALDAALGGIELRRWRPNVHVDLPDVPAFAEEHWEGGVLTVGDVALDLLHPCPRCVIPTRDPDTQEKRGEILAWLSRERDTLFGINTRVRGTGTLRVGDTVLVQGVRFV